MLIIACNLKIVSRKSKARPFGVAASRHSCPSSPPSEGNKLFPLIASSAGGTYSGRNPACARVYDGRAYVLASQERARTEGRPDPARTVKTQRTAHRQKCFGMEGMPFGMDRSAWPRCVLSTALHRKCGKLLRREPSMGAVPRAKPAHRLSLPKRLRTRKNRVDSPVFTVAFKRSVGSLSFRQSSAARLEQLCTW